MPAAVRVLSAACTAIALAACTARPPAAPPPLPPTGAARVLGHHPVCEASGAVFVPCEDGTGRCLLVADNERKAELFLYTVAGDALQDQRPVPLRRGAVPEAIKDAEGLARFGTRIAVLGSHSRRSWDMREPRCTLDEQRLAFGLFSLAGGELQGEVVRTPLADWQQSLQASPCRERLVVAQGRDGALLADGVCAAIAAGQAEAQASREGCGRGVNFEGIAAVPARDGDEHLWFGLRGPLFDGHAVLLRLEAPEYLRFDAVATLDLGGHGVRDLTAAGGWLWIISGPSADHQEAGRLWRVPATQVADGARLRPEPAPGVSALPPFAEAIAVDADAGDAFVLVDGDEERGPGDTNGCPTPAQYLHLRLP